MTQTIKIHRGDDTTAFGGGLFNITYRGGDVSISKVELVIGGISKSFEEPSFPIQMDLSSYESAINKVGTYEIKMTIYDAVGNRIIVPVDTNLAVVKDNEVFSVPYSNPELISLDTVLKNAVEPETPPEEEIPPEEQPPENQENPSGDSQEEQG